MHGCPSVEYSNHEFPNEHKKDRLLIPMSFRLQIFKGICVGRASRLTQSNIRPQASASESKTPAPHFRSPKQTAFSITAFLLFVG